MAETPIGKPTSGRLNYRYLQCRVNELLSVTERDDRAGRIIDLFLMTLIVLNVLAAILQTVEPLYAAWGRWFDGFEIISVGVFTAEYLLRIWSCTCQLKYQSPVVGRFRFAVTPLLLIDLVSIAPFFLMGIGALDLRMLRTVRLIRLLRVLKIARYSNSIQLLRRVLIAKQSEILITFCAGVMLLLFASSLMYYIEKEVQPDQFTSIPAAMWWGVSTLTTVGYGDMIPKTSVGKLLGSIIAVLGIGLFALPAGILGSGFVEEIQKSRLANLHCPHCGQKIDGR